MSEHATSDPGETNTRAISRTRQEVTDVTQRATRSQRSRRFTATLWLWPAPSSRKSVRSPQAGSCPGRTSNVPPRSCSPRAAKMGMRSSSSSGCADPGTMAVMPTSANNRELAAANAPSTCVATASGSSSPVLLLDLSGRGSPNRALARFFTSSENRLGGPRSEARLRARRPEVRTRRSRVALRRRMSGDAPAGMQQEGPRRSARARTTALGTTPDSPAAAKPSLSSSARSPSRAAAKTSAITRSKGVR